MKGKKKRVISSHRLEITYFDEISLSRKMPEKFLKPLSFEFHGDFSDKEEIDANKKEKDES